MAVDNEDRAPSRAPLSGDLLGGRRIEAFGYLPTAPSGQRDRVILEGSEPLSPAEAPPLAASLEAHECVKAAPRAVERLAMDQVRELDRSEQDFGLFDSLAEANDDWAEFAREAMSTLADVGHEVWVVGGPVRDVLAGRDPHAVNDLDLSGTATPEAFVQLVDDVLVLNGLGHLTLNVSPASLVCFVHDRVDRSKRLLEYKPLAAPQHAVPACASDFEADVSTRDLTFNALFYSASPPAILDPTGTGVDDLAATPRVLRTPTTPRRALEIGIVIVRSLKFMDRYERQSIAFDPAPIREFLDAHSWFDLGLLSDGESDQLETSFEKNIGSIELSDLHRLALALHPLAVELVDFHTVGVAQ